MCKDRSFVAIVDDEMSLRKALQRLLESTGADVETYPSGEAFLESLRTQTPACVILDIHMPGMSGIDVMKRLKETGMGLPVIVITGHDTPEIHKWALTAGLTGYLCKPFNDESLLEAIAGAMHP